VVVGDIGPSTQWKKVLSGVDVVIHLAARVHVMRENAVDPMAVFRAVNVDGTCLLAKQAAYAGVQRFVFISTIKVNGEKTTGRPFLSTDEPQPEGFYARSKAEAEMCLHNIASSSEMDVVIIRPPLVYGPGVGGNFLRLMQVIEKGFPLPLGMVRNTRSMVSRRNLCSLLVLCMDHPEVAGETFLISDGADLSTPELIRLLALGLGYPARLFPFPVPVLKAIARMTGKKSVIDRLTDSLVVDSERVRKCLEWEPSQSVEDGIIEVAQWYRESRIL
jgi:nucleoside-diphosphate-sugar epimerase